MACIHSVYQRRYLDNKPPKVPYMLKNFMTKFVASFAPSSRQMPLRRYDLDYLRVFAFMLLILFHCGMFYVENWEWHVKSQYRSALLENLMLLLSPWRMPLLWLISGIAMRFIMAKVTIARFISVRSLRLLLPLLFGILVIVPPQLYIEMTHNGDLNVNYWHFIQLFFRGGNGVFDNYQAGIWPHIDVNHLWFLRSLWQYSLVILCLLPLLNSSWIVRITSKLFKINGLIAVILSTLPIVLIEMFWQHSEQRYPLGFTFMLYGYLIGWHQDFWQRIANNITRLIPSFLISYFIVIYFYNTVWLVEQSTANVNPGWLLAIGTIIYSLLRIFGVLMLLAIACRYFNKNTHYLPYLSEAVYPFYILHQSFIVVFGYHLTHYNLGAGLEASILIVSTFIACILSFELIKRVNILRPCFGLKMRPSKYLLSQRLSYTLATILIAPLALKLLI